jgi:hypothetical protein
MNPFIRDIRSLYHSFLHKNYYKNNKYNIESPKRIHIHNIDIKYIKPCNFDPKIH